MTAPTRKAHARVARIQERAKFELGMLALSSTLVPLVEAGAFNPVAYLERHARGDWGDPTLETLLQRTVT